MINHCTQGKVDPTEKKVVTQLLRNKRTNKEFKLSAQIGEYNIDNVILDLGSNVNMIPNHTWEIMGKPNLVWSPIQLRLSNQYKIVSISRLIEILVNIYRVSNIVDFKFIEIVNENQPYPTLMGLKWDFDNQAIIT
jgi:hypothetical protein